MEYLPISADQGITDDSIGSSPLSQPILTTHKVPEQTLRKVALRLGHLDEKNAEWQLRPGVLKTLLKNERRWEDLRDEDFHYYARQKVVDMKVGIDITLLAQKRIVDRIVLVAGDSDFVPAAKHARREGIDFVLDPMWNPISLDLHEHIDGLRSTSPKPGSKGVPEKDVSNYEDTDDL